MAVWGEKCAWANSQPRPLTWAKRHRASLGRLPSCPGSLQYFTCRDGLVSTGQRLLVAFTCLTVFALAVGELQAQPDDGADNSREYAIKAAYLYQFGRYVQWPAEAFVDERSPLVIGVLGADSFGGVLDEIARSKQVDGRPIVVRRFASMSDCAALSYLVCFRRH